MGSPVLKLLLLWGLCAGAAQAGPLRERWQAERAGAPVTGLPADARLVPNVPYGQAERQRFDVYLPPQGAKEAPVIFLVHGGAWRIGDKRHANLLGNKLARWIPRGFVVVAVNYRMLPAADPSVQAQDVALALKLARERAAAWGAAPGRFILMGHSAGAHLVALLNASGLDGARPWLGAVLLDSAALDVPRIMEQRHPRFYDEAFGKEPPFWREVSPLHRLTGRTPPVLAVCSSRRADSCGQAEAFVAKAASLGSRVQSLPVALSHGEINDRLGIEGGYTRAVERFMGSLDAAVEQALR